MCLENISWLMGSSHPYCNPTTVQYFSMFLLKVHLPQRTVHMTRGGSSKLSSLLPHMSELSCHSSPKM